MTFQQIKEIIARVEAVHITKAEDLRPWKYKDKEGFHSFDLGFVEGSDDGEISICKEEYEFILHASRDIWDLLDALEEAQKEETYSLEELQERVKKALNDLQKKELELALKRGGFV